MIMAPIPANEHQRLESLRALKILDTPQEERFDRITQLAGRVFRVPLAYVSLVDQERQWFKSSIGMGACETQRDVSFCGHAILGEDTLVVPDALEDSRFRDNPMVVGAPKIRFYAGHPLSGPDGYKVGTFCIADRVPRRLTREDLSVLRDLAAIVERELNLGDVILVQEELLETRERAALAERRRTESLERLVASQEHLAKELAEAAHYVRSMLPEPLTGRVTTRSCFHPCSHLGGDAFGYQWIDDDHFAVYLIDVCGHGVGSALMSVSAINALRERTLTGVDFGQPDQVLAGLNRVFQMDRHDNRFFTIWYGVIDLVRGELRYASGGHPPALLVGRDEPEPRGQPLFTNNFFIGLERDSHFEAASVRLQGPSSLYLFSDGAFEIPKPAGGMMTVQELMDALTAHSLRGGIELDSVFNDLLGQAGSAGLQDDFSILQVVV